MSYPVCDIDLSRHHLTVLRDDGLYRHLRCKRPETGVYGFDVVTWPGHLTICGDIGTYTFTRTSDMFQFFESSAGGINPHYWGQKLAAPRPDSHRFYSEEVFRSRVAEWRNDTIKELDEGAAPDFDAAVSEQLLSGIADHEIQAHELLADFNHRGIFVRDSFEWDLRAYDPWFINCCWAIKWAIEQYRATNPKPTSGEGKG